MSVSAEQMQKDQWLQRMLGVSFERAAEEPPKSAMRGAPSDGAKEIKKKVRFEKKPNALGLPTRRTNDIVIGSGKPRSGAVIAPQLAPKQTTVAGPKGELKIARKTDGRIVYTAPPPPVGEITFSGGGGKGTALVGAVKALHESGVLDSTKKISGASVGSMTAALVAAGITPEDFEDIADDADITAQIKEGKNPTKGLIRYIATHSKKSAMTGKGLEDAVRGALDETLRKNITKYVNDCSAKSVAADPDVLDILDKLASGGGKKGPTFGDYRVLSKVVPGVKEVVMTGTFVSARLADGQDLDADKGQLYIFNADTEPNMEVALAVHASASFPGAFKPIEIEINGGMKVTFVDGGVMNNTPTSASLANERDLDPVPQQRGITFVFEDGEGDAEAMKKGQAKPKQGYGPRFLDARVAGADNAGAEMAKNRSAADKPNEIVVVPLRGKVQRKFLGIKYDHKVDMRGNFNGTLNFEPHMDKREALRALTKEATEKQIEADKKPKTREFASESQMFVSIPMDELQALADQNVQNADKAHLFRQRVAAGVDQLLTLAKARPDKPEPTDDKQEDKKAAEKYEADAGEWRAKVEDVLKKLDDFADDDIDFQGYVGRELNKREALDGLLEAERAANGKKADRSETQKASDAVAETLRVRGVANNILKGLVYPKMKMENSHKTEKAGSGIQALLVMEGILRSANTADDVNAAIQIGYDHFNRKSDKGLLKHGHREFARQIDRWRMTAH